MFAHDELLLSISGISVAISGIPGSHERIQPACSTSDNLCVVSLVLIHVGHIQYYNNLSIVYNMNRTAHPNNAKQTLVNKYTICILTHHRQLISFKVSRVSKVFQVISLPKSPEKKRTPEKTQNPTVYPYRSCSSSAVGHQSHPGIEGHYQAERH